MKKNITIFAGLLICVVALGLISVTWGSLRSYNISNSSEKIGNFLKNKKEVKIKLGDEGVLAEIASTTDKMSAGLSNRVSLPEGKAMLFIFSVSAKTGFWMKDMKFPIDIIWLDENLKIVSIKSNALPESFPEVFYPTENALYTLETRANFVLENKIHINQVAQIAE